MIVPKSTLRCRQAKEELAGIISHREELMENIPHQIRIEKTNEEGRTDIDTEF